VGFETWKAFYQSDLQAVWAVSLAPAVFLLARAAGLRARGPGAVPSRAPFVEAWCLLFAAETILDAVATGPLVRALGWSGQGAGLAVTIAFVLVGDFRFFWLLFAVAEPARSLAACARRAAAFTLLVPVAALGATRALHAVVSDLPDETIWLVYELAFLALALGLRFVWLPRRAAGAGAAWLRGVVGWAIAYYALWATADVVILALGLDAGWLLRAVPNQLYYALFVPFVWLSFFARR
jgi:hypothetical protein